ncbi:MAG TPA: hypothetical protein PLR41_11935 [Alphaproteobacteria bacterium]|nr:hypothetical protein [Alphaproteobacteria bacterium]
MRTLAASVCTLVVAFSIPVSDAHAEALFIDPASATGNRAVELALPQLRKNVPDAKEYKATIVRMKDNVGVLFCQPAPSVAMQAGDILGCSDDGFRFEVLLDPGITHVIKAYFSR